jgi:hypothetical protein
MTSTTAFFLPHLRVHRLQIARRHDVHLHVVARPEFLGADVRIARRGDGRRRHE